MAPITTWLILINVATFILQQSFGNTLIANFALWPIGSYFAQDLNATVGFRWWQLVTCAFLHGNILHITLNMYLVYLFGHDVERILGRRYYLSLYFVAVITASSVQLGVVTATTSSGVHPTLGASGGVFGILLAFGMLFPYRKLVLLLPPIVMPAWLFVMLS